MNVFSNDTQSVRSRDAPRGGCDVPSAPPARWMIPLIFALLVIGNLLFFGGLRSFEIVQGDSLLLLRLQVKLLLMSCGLATNMAAEMFIVYWAMRPTLIHQLVSCLFLMLASVIEFILVF